MTDLINFTPLETFRDEDLRSDYVVGFNYTIRPGNARLAEKVSEWLEAGKVRLGTADGTDSARAAVKGTGFVK